MEVALLRWPTETSRRDSLIAAAHDETVKSGAASGPQLGAGDGKAADNGKSAAPEEETPATAR